jgi:glycosyltransferase involved in cell wall biosynthesis
MDLSIIVPIYNTKEELLIRCLSSIQQINGVEFECILIDDGSSEEVEALCCDFLEKDSRFLYYRKENGGVSSARNEGVRRASGQFLCFVDADDLVVPKAFSTPDVLNPDYDVTFTDLEEVCGDKRTVWSAFTSPGDINYETVIRRMMENGTLNGPYCKIYKRSFLQTVGVQFREDMIQGEDAVFALVAALKTG